MKTNVMTKRYLSDNEKFADVFNYILYNGEPIIKAEELYDSDANELMMKEVEKRNTIVKDKLRDIKKEWILKKDNNAVYLMLGIENQTDIHYAMPPRNMLYDALEYDRQMNLIKKGHMVKGDLSRAEYVSGFAKTDKLVPVVTLVVYFGDEEWDGPRTLHEMFSIDDKKLLDHISDYKLNIIVPAEIKDFDKFSSDFKYVIEFLQNTKDDDKLYKIMNNFKDEFGNIDSETAMLLNQVAHLELDIDETEEKVDMCKAWNDRIEKGRQAGIQEERERAEKEKQAMCKAWNDRIEKGRQAGIQEERERAEKEKQAMCKSIEAIINNVKNNPDFSQEEVIKQLIAVMG